MRLVFTPKFTKKYIQAPSEIQRAFDKQSKFLVFNLRHPSLHAKKYDESGDLWQARVTGNWRFYFTIEGNEYHLHDIKTHPK
jgi:mRNA-degrading endonuclease RelE of RelBE toxin-antitoxin system